MKTYNFFIRRGQMTFIIEVNAKSEEEAITTIELQYPFSNGWSYMLI